MEGTVEVGGLVVVILDALPLRVEVPTLGLTDPGPKSALGIIFPGVSLVMVGSLGLVLLATAGGTPVFMDLDLTLEDVGSLSDCNSLLAVDTSFLSAAALSTFCILLVANAKSFASGVFRIIFATLLCVGLAV